MCVRERMCRGWGCFVSICPCVLTCLCIYLWFDLVWFYGVSTIVGFLILFICLYDIWFLNTFYHIFKQAWVHFFHTVKWFKFYHTEIIPLTINLLANSLSFVSFPLVLWYIIDRTLSGATRLRKSGPWSNGKNSIPLRLCITGTSLSDCLVSYTGHSLGWGLTSL